MLGCKTLTNFVKKSTGSMDSIWRTWAHWRASVSEGLANGLNRKAGSSGMN